MRKSVVTASVFAVLAATAATAQYLPPKSNSGSPVQITTQQGVDPAIAAAPRITREEAIKLVRENKAVYVDVRSKMSFDKGHIKGALSVPNSQLMSRIRELPAGKMVITYCACTKEHTAAVAVVNLRSAGWKNAAALTGGWDEWIALGLPTEKTK
ncbi:MAG TPA: rhodanese-like domain-containing protein [Thermoanaerobaculia bacterium]|nr:rhodanese-like domain-containing protein [Thermoanaerobaculia bacterium]